MSRKMGRKKSTGNKGDMGGRGEEDERGQNKMIKEADRRELQKQINRK